MKEVLKKVFNDVFVLLITVKCLSGEFNCIGVGDQSTGQTVSRLNFGRAVMIKGIKRA